MEGARQAVASHAVSPVITSIDKHPIDTTTSIIKPPPPAPATYTIPTVLSGHFNHLSSPPNTDYSISGAALFGLPISPTSFANTHPIKRIATELEKEAVDGHSSTAEWSASLLLPVWWASCPSQTRPCRRLRLSDSTPRSMQCGRRCQVPLVKCMSYESSLLFPSFS